MEHAQHIVFGPFRLGLTKKRLWRGEQALELRPMAVAVLRYLAERPGQLVSKGELLKQVWAGTIVTKTALKVCVREIRQALALMTWGVATTDETRACPMNSTT